MKNVVQVAIGLLTYQGQILVGWREAHQHQGGKSEFPGGKVETGEAPEQACRREILEEVGIELGDLHLFQQLRHEYEDLIVELWFYQAAVTQTQAAVIQAPWRWVARTELEQLNFPSANRAIVQRLMWSPWIKILTCVDALAQMQWPSSALLYLRFEQASYTQAMVVLQQMAAKTPERLQQLILPQALYEQCPVALQHAIFAIHLNQHQLMQTQQLSVENKNYMAACHDQAAVQQAQQLGCHAIFISPVCATQTHPDATPLGWAEFRRLSATFTGLSYALGGQTPDGLAFAQQQGAYGVAGIRAF